MKYQKIVAIALLSVITTSCGGKKNNTAAPAPSKNNSTTENSVSKKTLDLSGINVTNAKVSKEHGGLTKVTGLLSGDLKAVIPCSLNKAITINAKIGESLPTLNLNNVVVADRGITKGRINTFIINRNGKSQSILGLSLKDNQGKAVAEQKVNYSDLENSTNDCTQMMNEKYDVLNPDGKKSTRSVYRVSVLEGSTILKTTIVLDGTKISGIQLEKKNENNSVEQYCVQSANLASSR